MIKVGIIGAGRIGKVHGESIFTRVPNAVVKTIADPFMNEETEKWAAAHGILNTTKDYKEILADPEIVAVLICSSTDTHSPISVEALNAGKHVFCEKPIDHDLYNIKKVIETVEATGLKYQVGFNRRFDHNFMAVKQAIENGKIGKLETIRIMSRDPEPPPVEYIKVSGGIFLDMMIHDFDMVRFLSGKNAEAVFATGAVMVDPAIGEAGDVDTAMVTIKMEDGTLAHIDNNRRAAYGYDQYAEAFGSLGAAATGNDRASECVISNDCGVTAEKPLYFFLERYMEAYANEVKSFIDAVVNDTDTKVNVYDGLEPVRMGLAATKSLKKGRPVFLDEIVI